MTDKQRYHYERWKLLISDRMQSGMSTIEWCASRGVTKDAYYYWMNKFRKENVDKIFSVFNSKKEYIANIHDLYSEPGESAVRLSR